MTTPDRIAQLLENLSGEPLPIPDGASGVEVFSGSGGLGLSQFNELLLLVGLDRVSQAFFAYLRNGTTEYNPGDGFASLEQLEEGVERFRAIALLIYGNVKFGFKTLSHDPDWLKDELDQLEPLDVAEFEARHDPIFPVHPIPPRETYLTGYLIERELRERLARDAFDVEAQRLEEQRRKTVEKALRNQRAYYASDHMDVYVATSMRRRHEYLAISHLVGEIFDHEALRSLKLRWFDPTQAYCSNRIDKGLAEALMLKRATCTIYLAQESDTLGKDSELASTLAQGKPVIAYVPEVDEGYLERYLTMLREADPDSSDVNLMLEQLRVFSPEAAWSEARVRGWCETPEDVDPDELKGELLTRMREHYDGRARTLREIHPLGVQVNLGTGVANGVLVVRTSDECARLVRAIVTRRLKFDVERITEGLALRERISGCIFRVMTSDTMLTNTFWNFYLDPAE